MVIIEQKLDAIHEAFKEVSDVLSPAKLDKFILSRLGYGVKTKARQSVRVLVKQRSGAMYKGVYTYYNKKKNQQIVTNNAARAGVLGKKDGRYPWILAAGKRLDPRSGRTLILGERDWVEGPGNRYLYSNKADDDIEKVLERELKKLQAKGVLA